MHSNQNLIAPLIGVSSDALQPVIGAFNFEKMKYTDKEEWRDVPGYEGLYQVSSHGRVKSLIRRVKIGINTRIVGGNILSNDINWSGYSRVTLYCLGRAKKISSHQLVAMAFMNHKPDGTTQICSDHIDHNKNNNHVSNIQLISNRENLTKDLHGFSSRYAGVYWNKKNRNWRGRITIGRKDISLGTFILEVDAHNAYQDVLWSLKGTGKITRYSLSKNKIISIQATRDNYETLIRTNKWNK